ncbi:uncharacterized protein F54H12.2-like [Pleurodeles waltl]|uniref:uncharacterized protein F54H12.2-like n=1 Tax=Pleurodeles waltl TaxID=8319 RepID=UPI003709B560
MYAYRAYIESILNYSRDGLEPPGFQQDSSTKRLKAILKLRRWDGHNQGFVKRANCATGSRQFGLVGCIHSDLFYQDKLLVNGINLKIKLTSNKDSFCLSGDAEQQKRVKVSPSDRLAHAKALHLLNAKYAMERVALEIYSISTGTRLTHQQNVFLGQLTKLNIIGFMDNTTFSDLYTSNPFYFKHYDINYAALVHEGAVIPTKPYTLSFRTANFIREYLGLLSTTGKHLRDSGVITSREGYGGGYTLFAFDLMPDMEDRDHYNLMKNGNLKVEICFSQPLATNENIIVFAVFDSAIQVNHTRQNMFDHL